MSYFNGLGDGQNRIQPIFEKTPTVDDTIPSGDEINADKTNSSVPAGACEFLSCSEVKPFVFGKPDEESYNRPETRQPQNHNSNDFLNGAMDKVQELLQSLMELIKNLLNSNNNSAEDSKGGKGEGNATTPATGNNGRAFAEPPTSAQPNAEQPSAKVQATPESQLSTQAGQPNGTPPENAEIAPAKGHQNPGVQPGHIAAHIDSAEKAQSAKESEITQEKANAADGPKAVDMNRTVDPSKKALNLKNDTNENITIKFTPNAGGKPIDDITLKPGESVSQEMPEGWAGNIRKQTNNNDIATLGEFKFGGHAGADNVDGKNQSYYDVSLIEGYNGNMTITPSDGGKTSGSNKDLLDGAPDNAKAKDESGNVIGLKKTTVAEQFNEDVVNYLRKKVAPDESYVKPKDDLSTLGTKQNQFDVVFH